jgi:RNA polymerase sigma factor (sigma-70 family)
VTVPPFERLLEEHGAVVMRVCRALLGPADAEDAWSETFIAALGAYPRLRPDSNIRGWLVTIAHRKAIDQIRASARAPVPIGDLPDSIPPSGAAPASAGEADSVVERDPALWGALEALPFKQRGAVAYHYLAGLPYAEVGVLLGSSEAAARRSAADGLANLRKTYPTAEPASSAGREEPTP